MSRRNSDDEFPNNERSPDDAPRLHALLLCVMAIIAVLTGMAFRSIRTRQSDGVQCTSNLR
jgi:hypothetical protein